LNYISTISFYFILLFSLSCVDAIGQKFTKVPTQYLELYKLLGYENKNKIDTVKGFEISNFITYKQYKKYLNSIKPDSSEQFYISQLPDTNITIEKDVYQEYITSNAYDKYPVLGISWKNAMNYCRWKTLEDNKKGKIDFVYRLPYESEWLAALNYFKLNKIKHDLDQKYSDWLLNAFDESVYNFRFNSKFDYSYSHKKEDPPVLKRKKVIGESYLYNILFFKYGYSYIGYQQIAFRIVKTKVDESILEYWGIDK
jgi:hypothetical protein